MSSVSSLRFAPDEIPSGPPTPRVGDAPNWLSSIAW